MENVIIGYYLDSTMMCFAVDANGDMRFLSEGDAIYEGESVIDMFGTEQPQFISTEGLEDTSSDTLETDDTSSDSDDISYNEDSNYSSSTTFILNGDQTAIVSEEGLVDGITVDNTGVPDTTNDTVVNGQFELAEIVSVVKLEVPTEYYTSQGEGIEWSLSDDGQTLTGTAGDKNIIKVEVNNAGEYTTTLLGSN